MNITIWIIIAVVLMCMMAVIGIYNVLKQGEKSYADKIISIICAVLGVIIALFGIPYTTQNVQVIKKNEVIADKEQILLIDAEKDIRIGDYDTAKANYEKLCEEGYNSGILGMGYLFAHGMGVPQDVNKAMELYNSIIEEPQARKNRLILLIATSSEIELIRSELAYFVDNGDKSVVDFLMSCGALKEKQLLIEDLMIDDLKHYAFVGTKDFKNPPRDTGFSYFKFVGAYYPDEGNSSLPVYTYEEYDLQFIDKVETMTLTK